jgi:two-component system nitrate/nitrite response regulator NarL
MALENFAASAVSTLDESPETTTMPSDGGRFPFHTLTGRERQIADGVAKGLSNRDIAASLGITEQTVKNHLTAIFNKLQVTSRLQLALAILKGRE